VLDNHISRPDSRSREAGPSGLSHTKKEFSDPPITPPVPEAASIPLPASYVAGEMEIDDSGKEPQSGEKGTIQIMLALLLTANLILLLFQMLRVDPLQRSGGRM
jgi:hypothetical protein